VKDEQRRPAGRGLTGSVAAAVRRRQQDREPRVVLYNATGQPRVLAPGAAGYEGLLDTADQLIRLTSPA
jgi:hypothetical protein